MAWKIMKKRKNTEKTPEIAILKNGICLEKKTENRWPYLQQNKFRARLGKKIYGKSHIMLNSSISFLYMYVL